MCARPAPALVPHSQGAVGLREGSAGTRRERTVRGEPGARRGPRTAAWSPGASGCGFCRGGVPSSAPGKDKRPRNPPAGLAPAPARPRRVPPHSTAGPRTYRAGGESGAPSSSCAPEPPGPVRHLRRAGRGRAGPRRWGGGERLNHCGCAGGSGPAASGVAPGPG